MHLGDNGIKHRVTAAQDARIHKAFLSLLTGDNAEITVQYTGGSQTFWAQGTPLHCYFTAPYIHVKYVVNLSPTRENEGKYLFTFEQIENNCNTW